MRLIIRLGLLFYTFVILALVVFSISLALHVIPIQYIDSIVRVIYEDQQLRLIVGLIGVLIFLMNILFTRAIAGKELREKNIAFDNPTGRVFITLSAVEDLIRRVCLRLDEVKDVRAVRIKVGKRGLDVRLNLALNCEVSIPEATAHLQEIVKRKILDTTGLEETVHVRVEVSKIVDDESRPVKDKGHKVSSAGIDSTVPFQGYRA